jgi:hypothetical protein
MQKLAVVSSTVMELRDGFFERPTAPLRSRMISWREPCNANGNHLHMSSMAGSAVQRSSPDAAGSSPQALTPDPALSDPDGCSLQTIPGSCTIFTGLVLKLATQLWELLSDKEIVGGASKPAAWMQDVEYYSNDALI